MPTAQITERPKALTQPGDDEAPELVGAQVLQFPAPWDETDPAAALARIVGTLTKRQSALLSKEIVALSAAVAAEPLPASDKEYPEGIRPRHSERCATKRDRGDCDCDPPFEASVWSTFDKKKIRKTLPTLQAAIKWRRRHLGIAESGKLRSPVKITLAEAAYTWLEKAEAGEILNRSGEQYKPSALRTLESDFRLRLIPQLGRRFMSDIEQPDLQDVVIAVQRERSPSKVHACVNAARVLWRDFDLITGHAKLPTNPTKGLRLPAVPLTRDRIATPEEAQRLIAALEERDQALWATAMYAGLRCGELRALRADKIEFHLKRIRVTAGWDAFEGEIEPKTEKGRRTTIIVDLLEEILRKHLERTGRSGNDLVFGRKADEPFCPSSIHKRAKKLWKEAREREDAEGIIPEHDRIKPIGLHDSRHTAVSHWLDAGIPIDKVSKYMGHASITITIDRYAHLLPGGEAEAAEILKDYYARRRERRRATAATVVGEPDDSGSVSQASGMRQQAQVPRLREPVASGPLSGE
ncbi:MAG: site-specific integrase [Solirubrobacteraceae bacterium]